MTSTSPSQPPVGIDPFIWTFGVSEIRRAVAALAAVAIAHGVVDSSQSGAFVEIGVGVASYAITVLLNWWMLKGHALVEAQFTKLSSHVAAIPVTAQDTAATKTAVAAAKAVAN